MRRLDVTPFGEHPLEIGARCGAGGGVAGLRRAETLVAGEEGSDLERRMATECKGMIERQIERERAGDEILESTLGTCVATLTRKPRIPRPSMSHACGPTSTTPDSPFVVWFRN